jgi:hypothetical protein
MGLANILKRLLIGKAFTIEDGKISLFGRMNWTLLSSKAFAANLQKIGEDLGEDYLFKLGFEAGDDAAKEMVKSMGLKMKGGWVTLNAIKETLDFIGFGLVNFERAELKKDGHHDIIMRVRDNPVVEHSIKMFGNKSLACKWFMGVYSAHLQYDLGAKNARVIEKECIKHGSKYCEMVTKW